MWDEEWYNDHLPTIKEYVVSGPVWSSESWRYTGRKFTAEFAEKPLLEWEDGFWGALEGGAENSWRWCSSEGTLIINNTSNTERTFVMSARFSTGYPELSNLTIESSLVNENLQINNSGYRYEKEITVPPGSHAIKFSCDAERVESTLDPRYLVFRIDNFEMVEID
jgi:hypothetical protein